MKNFSKSIAAISMSLLTVAAVGQAVHLKPIALKHAVNTRTLRAKEMSVLHQGPKTQSIAVSATHLDLEYFNTDEGLVGSANYAYWNPPGYCNMRYTAADTGAGTNKNYNVNHAAIVAFDTLVDVNDNATYSTAAGELRVDTIFAILGYHNTSGTNDTLIFQIGKVAANGYPTGASFTADTVIVPPHSTALPGNVLDSLYQIYITPGPGGNGYFIPSTAPLGYKFNVTLEVYGSKLDTLGPFYASPYFDCAPYDWALRTEVGPTMGAAENVNSFMTGFQFYNTAAYGGNGTVLTWPNASGDLYNSAGPFGDYWGTTTCAAPDDTGYIYFQDLFISVGVDLNEVPLGIANVDNSGLSVAQNSPNPFNRETTINYSLTKASDVTFKVYDITGRVITSNSYGTVAPGQYQINLSANSFSPGVYFYTFNVGGNMITKKMIITQ